MLTNYHLVMTSVFAHHIACKPIRRVPHRVRTFIAIVAASIFSAACASQQPTARVSSRGGATPLDRDYVEGETTRYIMTGVNQGREHTLKYTAEAQSTVARDDQGRFVEQFRWTRLL